jgi:hypothetical protein
MKVCARFPEFTLAEMQGRQEYSGPIKPTGRLLPILRLSATHFAFPSRAELTAQIHDTTPYATTGELMTSWTL